MHLLRTVFQSSRFICTLLSQSLRSFKMYELLNPSCEYQIYVYTESFPKILVALLILDEI